MKAVGNRQLAVGKKILIKSVLIAVVLPIAYCLLPTWAFSQDIIATASLDTNSILIGQQTKLTLRVEYKTDQGEVKIDFPNKERVVDLIYSLEEKRNKLIYGSSTKLEIEQVLHVFENLKEFELSFSDILMK